MDWDITGSTAGISKVWDRPHVRARRSLAVTCIVLGVALLTFTGCDSESLFGGASSETEKALSIFDASAVVVAHLDVESGIESLEDLMSDGRASEDDLSAMMEQVSSYLGLNPRKDIHHVYVSLSGLDSTAVGSLIAFADFNQEAMISRLDSISELTRIDTAGKSDSYRLSESDDLQFSLVDGSMILVSNNSEQLARLVSRANGPESSSINDVLLRQLEKRESWMVVRNVNLFLPAMDSMEVGNQFAQILPAIQAIQSVGIGVNTTGRELEGVLLVQPTAEVTAKDLANVFSGIRAAARIGLADFPKVLEHMEAIDISTVKGLVEISLDIDEAQLKDLMKTMGSQMAGIAGMAHDRLQKEDAK